MIFWFDGEPVTLAGRRHFVAIFYDDYGFDYRDGDDSARKPKNRFEQRHLQSVPLAPYLLELGNAPTRTARLWRSPACIQHKAIMWGPPCKMQCAGGLAMQFDGRA
jgi:hypothetical protein